VEQWFLNFFSSSIICKFRTLTTYHLVPGKHILPNIIQSKVWKSRLDTNIHEQNGCEKL